MGLRILPCQDDGLRPDPAACFQDLTSRRIAGVIMEQSGQRVGLVEQTLVFPVRISMNIAWQGSYSSLRSAQHGKQETAV